MYLERAKEILENEYHLQREKNVVKHYLDVMDEKIKHSYQVLGVGNYLLKHEDCFKNYSAEDKDFFQAVVLLHDLGRFYEILRAGEGERVDHCVYGSQMLSEIEEFNSVEAVLAVRYHGCLIEELYKDERYKSLSNEEQERVEKLTFLVRDADKLANFYLLMSDFEEMEPLFYVPKSFENPYVKTVSDVIAEEFFTHKSVNRKYVTNFAEWTLQYLSWVFDLNYKYSFVFLQKLNILSKLEDFWTKHFYEEDREKFYTCLNEYMAEKLKMMK